MVTGQTSAGVHARRTETEQVATAMNEMTATVHEVAQNSEEAAQAAKRADEQAQDGNEVLQKALGSLQILSTEVQHSADAMHRLNENSESISTVLTLIAGIADQSAAAVEEMAASSAELARLGQSLQVEVAQFRI